MCEIWRFCTKIGIRVHKKIYKEVDIIHSFHGKSVNIHYDADVKTGECIITNKENGQEIRANGRDLLNFVAEYVREQKIVKIESAGTTDILGI